MSRSIVQRELTVCACRCAIIPHIGSATIETREAMAMLCAQNLVDGLKGEKIGVEYALA
jgi:glyoxylate/hydroxypyruvate reductase